MPKKIDYPHASITKSIELAEAVYALGGTSSIEMCAEQMGRKVGGGFNSIVSAATKFGMITKTRGQLAITELFKDYHLGYSNEEKSEILRSSFLHVPLFHEIYERFKNQILPIKILDRLLIREFNVNQQDASRVSKYFIDGSKATELLNSDNSFCTVNLDLPDSHPEEKIDKSEANTSQDQTHSIINTTSPTSTEDLNNDEFTVRISGPGINSTLTIKEEDDLDIVEVMLKKVRKKLLEPSE